jgi:aspartyl-tRNA(Asn)/glutamyl-tRNA(Gln) amidotransferase subunit C
LSENEKAISLDQVRHIAHLARIDLRDGDLERFTSQVGEILGYVNTLQNIPTDGIDPTFLITPQSNVLRQDTVKPCLTPGQALQNAPGREGDHFRMPPILGGDGA